MTDLEDSNSLSDKASDDGLVEPETGTQDLSKTFVVIFDSLGSRYRKSAIEKLKDFVVAEAKRSCGKVISKRRILAMYPKVPVQNNHTDCGCFLLEYVERFLQDPDEVVMRILLKEDLSLWFSSEDAALRRLKLKELIDQMSTEQVPDDTADHDFASSDIEEIPGPLNQSAALELDPI